MFDKTLNQAKGLTVFQGALAACSTLYGSIRITGTLIETNIKTDVCPSSLINRQKGDNHGSPCFVVRGGGGGVSHLIVLINLGIATGSGFNGVASWLQMLKPVPEKETLALTGTSLCISCLLGEIFPTGILGVL